MFKTLNHVDVYDDAHHDFPVSPVRQGIFSWTDTVDLQNVLWYSLPLIKLLI